MHRGLADIPPTADHVVACKVCGLVKTFKQVIENSWGLVTDLPQFQERGCENCPFLEMKGDRQAVEDGTTAAFTGMATIMDPKSGWASRWMHINNLAAGVYCLCVEEELPYEVKDMLENKDINYRIRDDAFYPSESGPS